MLPERLPQRLVALSVATILVACGGAATSVPASPTAPLTTSPIASPTTLLPDGAWQVELSQKELAAAGAPDYAPGTYRWTFDGTHAHITAPAPWGGLIECDAEASADGDAVLLAYAADSGCGVGRDRIQWTLEADGLHLKLLETTQDLKENRAYLEAKPWQPAEAAASQTQAPGAGNALNVGCSNAAQCKLSAGTWTLTGQFSFILGMELTVPGGWQSLEQDAGEFNLWPLAHPNDHLFMARDIAAVHSDGSMKVADGVPQTEAGLVAYWRQDPNLVVSEPMPTTIADGIKATAYDIRISRDAKFKDPGCPSYPRCADFFTDPAHWDGAVYGIGAPAAVRLYFAAIGSGADEHLLVIGLEGGNAKALERLIRDATPIIDSIRLPATITVW